MRLVIPSVGYADMLRVTLPAWQRAAPGATVGVVTAPGDASVEVARAYGVVPLETDVWRREAVFNKGAALDLAFGFVAGLVGPPAVGEVCISVDADVYPCGPVPAGLGERDTIYGCPRYECATTQALEDYVRGRRPRKSFKLIPPRQRGGGFKNVRAGESARACLGYFQAFAYRPGLRFGDSKTAGGYDTRFRERFRVRAAAPGFAVLHLGELDRANWRGRVVRAWQ